MTEIVITHIIEPWELPDFFEQAKECRGRSYGFINLKPNWNKNGKLYIEYSCAFENKDASDKYYMWGTQRERRQPK